ncbi:glycosyltransferase [Caldifermentibacillus hisashii]|uniref:glycosyltransferase n=1 Tax=Caldifermentibacillus hisashii TaxID=996558 RepID=UPI0031FE2ADA
MIFVTVGTHEQPFNRLIQEVDILVDKGIIKEEVIIQTGYSDYIPNSCKYKKMLSFQDMNTLTKDARIIITHGGPASILLAYSYGKVPVVVPRQKKYGEHVDNHQLLFCKRLEKEKKIILVDDIKSLEEKLLNYNNSLKKIERTNLNKTNFIKNFKDAVLEIM